MICVPEKGPFVKSASSTSTSRAFLTPFPAGVFWNAGINCAYASLGVEYATRVSLVSFVAPAAIAGSSKPIISKDRLIRRISSPY